MASVKIYGVYSASRYAVNEVCVRDGTLSKNGRAYTFRASHPAYGYRTRIRAAEACLTRDEAVEAWRKRVTADRDAALEEVAELTALLETEPEAEG